MTLNTLKRILERDIEANDSTNVTHVFCIPCLKEWKAGECEPFSCKDCKKTMCSHYAHLFNFATPTEYAMCLECVMSSNRYIVKRLADSFRKLADEIEKLQLKII